MHETPSKLSRPELITATCRFGGVLCEELGCSTEPSRVSTSDPEG